MADGKKRMGAFYKAEPIMKARDKGLYAKILKF